MNEIELLTAYRQEMHKIQIKNGFTDEQMTSYRQGFMDAIGEYERRIAADVQPVKHGRWELTNNPSFRKCSECGAWWGKEFTTNNYVNYCPRCGVDMREPNE